MSLTSYRAAPPRVVGVVVMRVWGGGWTWRRPTLPRLETQYHGRYGVSRPSSERDRVGHPRYDHQVEQPPAGPAADAGGGGGRAGKPWHGVALLQRGCRWRGSRSIERLGPVSCTRCRAFTSGLSTWWSATALIARPGFEEGFPLRCFQRLSRPNLATRLCRWRDNRSTRGSSTPVLSY